MLNWMGESNFNNYLVFIVFWGVLILKVLDKVNDFIRKVEKEGIEMEERI